MSNESQTKIEFPFRRASGRLISVLTRIFRPQNLGLAQDVVQESFVAALSVGSEPTIQPSGCYSPAATGQLMPSVESTLGQLFPATLPNTLALPNPA